MAIMQEIETKLQKGISVSTDEEVYYALLELVKDKAEKKVSNKGKKKLYYISAACNKQCYEISSCIYSGTTRHWQNKYYNKHDSNSFF